MTNKTSDDPYFADPTSDFGNSADQTSDFGNSADQTSDDEDFADYTDDHQHKSPPDAAAVEEGRTPDVADSPETEPPD